MFENYFDKLKRFELENHDKIYIPQIRNLMLFDLLKLTWGYPPI